MHRGSRPWGRPYGVEEGVELGPYEVVVLAYEVDEPVPPVVYGRFDMTLARHQSHPHGTNMIGRRAGVIDLRR
jgi:hypothetical protein